MSGFLFKRKKFLCVFVALREMKKTPCVKKTINLSR